jgi:hypothetical protein
MARGAPQGRRIYYRSVKRGSRVVKESFGTGSTADLAEHLVAPDPDLPRGHAELGVTGPYSLRKRLDSAVLRGGTSSRTARDRPVRRATRCGTCPRWTTAGSPFLRARGSGSNAMSR